MSKVIKSIPNVLFILGGPGSGKGTQCARIAKHFGYVHLSAGELLRQEQDRSNSEYATQINECLKIGKILPVKITCSLLENAMNESGKETFLIDGFPRNKDNLDGWNKQMGSKANVRGVLFFECSNDVCVQRCLERGKQSGRSDDNEESLKKRIQTYTESTLPIVDHYDKLNLLKRVNGDRSVDEVFQDSKAVIEQIMSK